MAVENVLHAWSLKIDDAFGFLLGCFGEMLSEVGEDELGHVLRWVGQDPSEGEGTVARDRELQTLSIAFQLLNLAEEAAAVHARRHNEETAGPLGEPGLWGQNFRRLLDSGMDEDQLLALLKALHVEVVLTAHPTEAKRPVVLKQHRQLFEALLERELGGGGPRAMTALRSKIKLQLERLWRTGELHLHKPGVLNELAHALDFFRYIFPAALPRLDEQLREAWQAAGLSPVRLTSAENLPRLSFGNWVGGDRDGHPLVTAEITRETLLRLRQNAIDVLREHLEKLREALSLSDLFQSPPAEFRQEIEAVAASLGEVGAVVLRTSPREPWRQWVGLMLARLPLAETNSPAAYSAPEMLRDDLRKLRASLDAIGAARLAEADISPIERVLDAYGFHTARLDLRQNSTFHRHALIELYAAAGIDLSPYEDWPEARRRGFLDDELRALRPIVPRGAPLGVHAQAVIDLFNVLANHIAQFGREGIGPYIVSMTQDLSDLLVVYIFAREVGLLYQTPLGPAANLHVVPLFETTDDLERAPRIMRGFFGHPLVRASLAGERRPEPTQMVMVGYSDSTKGAGLFTSHWRLHEAQRALTTVAEECGACIWFFHGRGGTISRGAGPTHRFLEALPLGTLDGHFRLTEQGETIGQKYGNLPTAVYNLELLIAGTGAAAARHRSATPVDPLGDEVAAIWSALAEEAYCNLIGEEGLLSFWSEATPIDAIEESLIGSRPTRRTGRRTIEDLRAIPWVFSWIQARYYLTGWFGLGTAIETWRGSNPEQFERLCGNLGAFPFLRYVLTNAETGLASASLAHMHDYAALVGDVAVRERCLGLIEAEFRRTDTLINALFGAPRAQRRPRMMKTLQLRDAGLRRLHHTQIALLREWRGRRAAGDDARAAEMMPALLLSINAIASGQRVTG